MAEYLPDHIHSLIYLATILVPNGGSLDTDHSPFYSAPEELATQLIDLAAFLLRN